jgi:hypothetical protein
MIAEDGTVFLPTGDLRRDRLRRQGKQIRELLIGEAGLVTENLEKRIGGHDWER